MRVLRRHLATVLVAFATAVVTAGGPAMAAAVAQAVNADTVDGRHAVGYRASTENRAGKLVATNGAGRLPNGIIAIARDAERLDGLDASQFLRTVVPSGTTMRGEYGAWGGPGGYLGDAVTFPMRLPTDLGAEHVVWRSSLARPTAQCPGHGRAAAGSLCVYEVGGGSRRRATITAPEDGGRGASTTGFTVYFSAEGGGASFSYGTWAYTAP